MYVPIPGIVFLILVTGAMRLWTIFNAKQFTMVSY